MKKRNFHVFFGYLKKAIYFMKKKFHWKNDSLLMKYEGIGGPMTCNIFQLDNWTCIRKVTVIRSFRSQMVGNFRRNVSLIFEQIENSLWNSIDPFTILLDEICICVNYAIYQYLNFSMNRDFGVSSNLYLHNISPYLRC